MTMFSHRLCPRRQELAPSAKGLWRSDHLRITAYGTARVAAIAGRDLLQFAVDDLLPVV